MDKFEPKIEQKTSAKDISSEFLSMNAQEFLNFLRSQRKKLALSITINRDDNDSRLSEFTLIRLKAFLEDPDVIGKQKRFCYIRATEEQKNGPILSKSNCRNAFVSGIRWEKI